MIQEPVIKEKNKISSIWILPIIALTICGWLLYSSYRDAGVDITISFDDASGIQPGKTQVMAKGIPIGLVKELVPDLFNQQVVATVAIDKEAVEYLVDDTVFWIVRPELSASSIQGLDTILSGSYIGIQTGNSKNQQLKFKGLSSAPPISPDAPGLHIQLRAEVLGSIQVGTGVYYRNIEIGKVQKHQLERDESILIDLYIEPQFAHLVREGSRFCNTSGIQISGKLPSVKIQVESLASILRGGILLHTPEQLQETAQAQNNHIFSLYPDFDSANYGIPMTLTLASGKDIVEGSTKVMYRGLEAGFVKEIKINDDPRRTVTAHIMLDPRAEIILRKNTEFWLVKPEISPNGIQNLSLLLSGAHITFQPGDGEFTNHFNILPKPPAQKPLRAGTTLVLLSDQDNQLTHKSPVYFKNIHVGEVVDINLDKSGQKIRTTIFIYQQYFHLLSKKSVFWIHSGVTLNASLAKGFEFSSGPFAGLLHGGVSFTTPDKLHKKKNYPPEENFTYQLYESYDAAADIIPELQRTGRMIQIRSMDASSLSLHAPILYKNIQIGEIESFALSKDKSNVIIDSFIYDKYLHLINDKTRFYNNSGVKVSGGLGGIEVQTGSMHSIIAGGISCVNLPQASPKGQGEPFELYSSLKQATNADHIELTVYFKAISGLKEGAQVRLNSIKVGHIETLSIYEDLKTIVGKVYVQPKYESLFRRNTLMWVEDMEINFNGIRNADSIVYGAHLNFLPGDGPPQRVFEALEERPMSRIANMDGLGIVLETKHLGSLGPGSPVYYRQVQIGKVTDYELSPTFQKVFIHVAISDKYRAVIRSNTKFWNISGAKIEGGIFSGLTISTGSFESIMRGGISLATPEFDDKKEGEPAQSGDHFTLHDDPKKEWLDWNPDVVLLELEDSEKFFQEQNKQSQN